MWLYADFEPLTAFGLRPSNTTANGGKSLICPTPYAIKMAMLDRILRFAGEAFTHQVFPNIRDLKIWAQMPTAVAVNRTFQKVLRVQTKGEDDWVSTISQREYCFFAGTLTLAMESEGPLLEQLPSILASINYFGRKGSFMQFMGHRVLDSAPDSRTGFVNLCGASAANSIALHGFLQRMDDMRPDATFDDVSVYSEKKRGHDGGRIYRNIVFPYRLAHHGHNHTVYQRDDTYHDSQL